MSAAPITPTNRLSEPGAATADTQPAGGLGLAASAAEGAGVEVQHLRAARYVPTWELQQARARAVGAGTAGEALLLVEHTPVYTLGRRTDSEHLLETESQLAALGAEVVSVDRGGDVTWHGPGQVTGYPILDLKRRGRDLHRYVATLEELLIDIAASYGVKAHRAEGMPGVWVGREKLAALGVKLTHGWVTYHGFALNVDPALSWFDHIVPCGLHGYGVTSLSRLVGRHVSWEEVAQRVAERFGEHFRHLHA